MCFAVARSCRSSELFLLVQAAMWLVIARIALSLLSFRRLEPIVAFLTRTNRKQSNSRLATRAAGAVSSLSRYVPRATCLTQALALHVLLRRSGLESRIHIGVAKQHGHFKSHAWVESQDEVVIGDYDWKRYTTIIIWD